MASSGLRLGAALSLRLRDFLDDPWDEELQSYAIEVREDNSKTREPYITLISWETTEYLRDYLKARMVFADICVFSERDRRDTRDNNKPAGGHDLRDKPHN